MESRRFKEGGLRLERSNRVGKGKGNGMGWWKFRFCCWGLYREGEMWILMHGECTRGGEGFWICMSVGVVGW